MVKNRINREKPLNQVLSTNYMYKFIINNDNHQNSQLPESGHLMKDKIRDCMRLCGLWDPFFSFGFSFVSSKTMALVKAALYKFYFICIVTCDVMLHYN